MNRDSGNRGISQQDESRQIEHAYQCHADDLRRFLSGLTRNPEQVAEVTQTVFARLAENLSQVSPERIRGWLFRVAFNEVMLRRRRTGVDLRARPRVARAVDDGTSAPELPLVRQEEIERVRRAVESLPPEQQTVVRMRIYDELKFAEIAEKLNLPLGTVLGRMRQATQKLARALGTGTNKE